MRDISERKRAERELAEANVQFQAMVEQSIAGILIIQDGKFAYVNPRFCEILGYESADELIGSDPLSLIVEKDRRCDRADTMPPADRRGEIDRISYTFDGAAQGRLDGRAWSAQRPRHLSAAGPRSSG